MMATEESQLVTAEQRAPKELGRREVIKMAAAAAIATPLASLQGGDSVIEAAAASAATVKAPLFFTPEEFALVDELTELIIPTDDHSPGARAAQVAEYIDRRLAESWENGPKELWRKGLKIVDAVSQEMHGKAFMQASADQRVAALARMARNEMKPQNPEVAFFKELKARTVRAYYTSKIGVRTEMEYKGNTYLKEFSGYDAR